MARKPTAGGKQFWAWSEEKRTGNGAEAQLPKLQFIDIFLTLLWTCTESDLGYAVTSLKRVRMEFMYAVHGNSFTLQVTAGGALVLIRCGSDGQPGRPVHRQRVRQH